MKLTKYEKETIINYNQAESTATIYTHDADLKRRLAKYSKQHPDICKADKETREGSVSYTIDKSRLSIRLLPPISEERRKKASEYAKQHSFQSGTTEP